MATSGVATAEFDAAKVIELAAQRAGWGVQEISGGVSQVGRDLLIQVMNDWASASLVPWATEKRTLALVANTASYTLPADTVEVLSGASILVDGLDRPLSLIGRDDYEGIPDKTFSGPPSQYMIWRKTPPVLMFYPRPASAYTVSYWAVRRMHDVTAAIQTLDAPMRWVPAIQARLALELFNHMPAERRLQLLALLPEIQRAAASTEDTLRRANVEPTTWEAR